MCVFVVSKLSARLTRRYLYAPRRSLPPPSVRASSPSQRHYTALRALTHAPAPRDPGRAKANTTVLSLDLLPRKSVFVCVYPFKFKIVFVCAYVRTRNCVRVSYDRTSVQVSFIRSDRGDVLTDFFKRSSAARRKKIRVSPSRSSNAVKIKYETNTVIIIMISPLDVPAC